MPFALLVGGAGIGRPITTPELKRPGLALAGFLGGVVAGSIYVVGRNECAYLDGRPADERARNLAAFLASGPAAILLTDGLAPPGDLLAAAEAAGVPVLTTPAAETETIRFVDLLLERRLAPATSIHGVLMDVYGLGVLIAGESGVGKSETALELIQRGHRLVADDVVQIRRLHGDLLVGTSSEVLRHHMEIRGLGVIDVARLFGVRAILEEQQIDLLVRLEAWVEGVEYDRLGLETRTTPILGVEVPTLTVPVRLGRNLAVIVEGGAIHHRLKMLGHDAAREFTENLTRWIEDRPAGASAPEIDRPRRRYRGRPVRPRRPKR